LNVHHLLVSLALLSADPRSAQVKQAAYARVPKAHAIARDAQLVAFVTAKNARQESREEIRRKDAEWIAQPDHPLRRSLTQDECASRLRALTAADPVIVEALLMDGKGALVCATAAPSDYWQGDEPKWQRTFVEGRDPFVDELALDASTDEYAVQLSVPLLRDASRVGALTLTLRVPREFAARP
jgi:hypothetical protein